MLRPLGRNCRRTLLTQLMDRFKGRTLLHMESSPFLISLSFISIALWFRSYLLSNSSWRILICSGIKDTHIESKQYWLCVFNDVLSLFPSLSSLYFILSFIKSLLFGEDIYNLSHACWIALWNSKTQRLLAFSRVLTAY